MHSHVNKLYNIQNIINIQQIYDIYGATLYNIILQIVHTEELARKAMQDTFLKICRQDIDYSNSKLRSLTWILIIARSTAIDALTTKHGVSDSEYRYLDVWTGHPEKIDEKHQDLIELTYFKGYTQKEISEAMNIPISTIKTQLRLAISELRKFYKESDAALANR